MTIFLLDQLVGGKPSAVADFITAVRVGVAEDPDKVAALQNRVNELGATMAPPLFTQATTELIHTLSPAIPTADP